MLSASGVNFIILAMLSGFMLSLPHSIIVVMAQRLLPKRQGLASGAVLGFMFASGAAASGLVGWISDYTGLGAALHVVALLPVLAGICALSLPATRTPRIESLPEVAPAPGD
jgi:FSR family fosmidomycin resistance protein-like MFS transporter